MNWQPNSNHDDSTRIEVGDVVHLQLDGSYTYRVAAMVLATGSSEIKGRVLSVTDWVTDNPVLSDAVSVSIDDTLSFQPNAVHKILRESYS